MHLSRVLSPVQLVFTPSPLAVRVSTFGVAGEGVEGTAELILDEAGVEIVGFFCATMRLLEVVRNWQRSGHAPGLDAEGEWFSAAPPVARFALSTSFFHFFTISFAISDTRLSACDRSFPTARPALLSCHRR